VKSLLAVSRILDRLVNGAGRLAGWLILPMIGVIMFDVIMRHWFNIGSTMLQELEWHLHGTLFLLGLGWAYNKDNHVRIELVSEKLKSNIRIIIELTGIALFLIPYIIVIVTFGYDYFALSLANNEISASQTGLPMRYIIKGIMVFGFVLLGLAGVSRFITQLAVLKGAIPDPDEHHHAEGHS